MHVCRAGNIRAISERRTSNAHPRIAKRRRDTGTHSRALLEAADFTTLASETDAYLEQHGTLRGVLIRAESFPGWKDFGALLAHLKFLRGHLKKIEKVAVVADGALANIMPNIANHFVHTQVQHFALKREDDAWNWLRQSGNAQG